MASFFSINNSGEEKSEVGIRTEKKVKNSDEKKFIKNCVWNLKVRRDALRYLCDKRRHLNKKTFI